MMQLGTILRILLGTIFDRHERMLDGRVVTPAYRPSNGLQ
jgi:hypothetical protein